MKIGRFAQFSVNEIRWLGEKSAPLPSPQIFYLSFIRKIPAGNLYLTSWVENSVDPD